MGVKSIGKTAFDVIYNDNYDIVYKAAMKYSRNHHTAEEITQKVFLKLYMNMDHININAARSWLLLTAKYMALNYKRDMAREYLVEEMDEDEKKILSESCENPEDTFFRKMKEREFMKLKEDIFAALYKKNLRWYDAITITYVLEKPQKEVAENMGVTLEVLHSMLYRARQWIKKNFEEEYDHLNNA